MEFTPLLHRLQYASRLLHRTVPLRPPLANGENGGRRGTVLVLVIIYLRFHLILQNKKKDELAAAGIQEANDAELVHAFDDLTDRQNLNFRYMY
jgi:hypothetical protein